MKYIYKEVLLFTARREIIMTLEIIFCIKEVVVFFRMFFDPNVDKVLQHLFQLVKVHGVGLFCKGKK